MGSYSYKTLAGQITRLRRLPWGIRLVMGLVVVGTAFAFEQWMIRILGMPMRVFVLFFPAVMLVAVLLGAGPGLASTVLAAVLVDYYWLEPRGNLTISNTGDAISMAFFLLNCALICVLSETMARSRQRTEHLMVEAAMQKSNQMFQAAFQSSRDAMAISRLSDGVYLDVNQAFLNALGFPLEDVKGRSSRELNVWVNPEDRKYLLNTLAMQQSCSDIQVEIRRKNGSTFWALVWVSQIEVQGVPCMLSTVRDLSEERQAQEQIRTLAYFDPLTGLANRKLLMERLSTRLAPVERSPHWHALLAIDLDHFKELNDTAGHLTGDKALRLAAERLTECVRATDTAGRLGADEFLVLLEYLGPDAAEAAGQARALAEKIRQQIGRPMAIDGRQYQRSCSIGLAIFGNADPQELEALLQQADLALAEAKASGGNTIRYFSPELQEAVIQRASLEEEMRLAIERGEFEVYYQPQMRGSSICGAEALVRWQHPRLGLLEPGAFIPLAEQTRLILPLGQWVLEKGCRQLGQWAAHEHTDKLRVAINVSALQLAQPEFVDDVRDALLAAGAGAERLELELTESMLIDDFDEVVEKLAELRRLGVAISIDDFGTGYSSLTYLKRMPLDQLKIDRSFVRDVLKDRSSSAIAATIIQLSHALGINVLAEGVETEEQRMALHGLGCQMYQGYLFSPPLPAAGFEQLLGRWPVH